ncbi:RNA-directed DNA polymerase, eukaryota [Tanacetum coccineum]
MLTFLRIILHHRVLGDKEERGLINMLPNQIHRKFIVMRKTPNASIRINKLFRLQVGDMRNKGVEFSFCSSDINRSTPIPKPRTICNALLNKAIFVFFELAKEVKHLLALEVLDDWEQALFSLIKFSKPGGLELSGLIFLSHDDKFSVNSVRKHIDELSLPSLSPSTRWCKIIPRKVNIFMWQMLLDGLPNRLNLSSRDLHIDSIMCPVCNVSVESSAHTFFSCDTASVVWHRVRVWSGSMLPSFSSCGEWDLWFQSWNASKEKKDRAYAIFAASDVPAEPMRPSYLPLDMEVAINGFSLIALNCSFVSSLLANEEGHELTEITDTKDSKEENDNTDDLKHKQEIKENKITPMEITMTLRMVAGAIANLCGNDMKTKRKAAPRVNSSPALYIASNISSVDPDVLQAPTLAIRITDSVSRPCEGGDYIIGRSTSILTPAKGKRKSDDRLELDHSLESPFTHKRQRTNDLDKIFVANNKFHGPVNIKTNGSLSHAYTSGSSDSVSFVQHQSSSESHGQPNLSLAKGKRKLDEYVTVPVAHSPTTMIRTLHKH